MGSGSKSSKLTLVLCVASANALAMLDFFVFAFSASYINRAFFPADNEFASRLMSIMIFGTGFFMRPLGAIILGTYIDHGGRRRGLLVTMSVMVLGTILIAFAPSYATIGLAAPVLVVIGRLLQAFSAGAVLGCTSIYLFELATPAHRGFFTAWQPVGSQAGLLIAALMGFVLNTWVTPGDIGYWGWRTPLFIGCLLVPFAFATRRLLAETPDFLAFQPPPRTLEVLLSTARNLDVVLAGTLLVSVAVMSGYVFSSYIPSYAKIILKLTNTDNLLVIALFWLSSIFWTPIMATVSDRLGRRLVLIASAALTILTAYPAVSWLVAAPDFGKVLLIELWLSFLYASYNAAMIVALAEVAPALSRTTVYSLALALGTTLFGSFAPLATTNLLQIDRAAPALLAVSVAVCGIFVTWSDFLFSRTTRITRSHFWLQFFLPAAIISLALGFMVDIVFIADENWRAYLSSGRQIETLWAFIVVVAGLVVGVKRCHDLDRSGWFVLIGLIPIIGSIWLLIELGFLRGTVGTNRFGPEPGRIALAA
jgi:MFS transporter, MHS family, citrate/tricarballylate:H+ symporter